MCGFFFGFFIVLLGINIFINVIVINDIVLYCDIVYNFFLCIFSENGIN